MHRFLVVESPFVCAWPSNRDIVSRVLRSLALRRSLQGKRLEGCRHFVEGTFNVCVSSVVWPKYKAWIL